MELMRRIFSALRPGGVLVINDFVVNDERTGPPFPLLFSLNMLVHTEKGMTYSEGHYRRWLGEAGFQSVQRHDALGLSTLLVAWKS